MKIVGSVALVTGAGQGIGQAIARAFAAAGIKVAVNDLHAERALRTCRELLEQGCEAVAIPADVGDDAAVARMVQQAASALGSIDILVNNAASPAEPKLFARSTVEEQNAELLTLIGTLNCTRHVSPEMIRRRRGRIVNISSIAAQYAMPRRAVYSAANGGIDVFTRTMAKELGPYGITVNAVSPGGTETPRFKARSKELRDSMARTIALGRFAEPEDIADAVLFLAGDRAGYVNGVVLNVDGGFTGFAPPPISGE